MKISKEDIESARSLSGEMKSNQEQSMFEVKLLLDDEANDTYKDYKFLWDCYPNPSLPLKSDKYKKRLKAKIETEPQSKVVYGGGKLKALLYAVILGLILRS